MAAILTGDADIAQDYAISSEVEDSIPPIVDLLQGIDPSFRPLPHVSGSPRSNALRNSSGYRVEFLTMNRGSEEYADEPAQMPTLGGWEVVPGDGSSRICPIGSHRADGLSGNHPLLGCQELVAPPHLSASAVRSDFCLIRLHHCRCVAFPMRRQVRRSSPLTVRRLK